MSNTLIFNRGELTDGVVSLDDDVFRQEFGLSQLGNWSTFKQDADGNGTWNLDQTRDHNKANEIDDDNLHGDGLAGIGGTPAWTGVEYWANGNVKAFPQPGNETSQDPCQADYDAWGRLTQILVGGTTRAVYRYDGLGRRIGYQRNDAAGDTYDILHFYYNSNWQLLETRRQMEQGEDPDPLEQFLWSPRYIDAPVLRWWDADTDGEAILTLFYTNDANMNVTAEVDGSTGGVTERYT